MHSSIESHTEGHLYPPLPPEFAFLSSIGLATAQPLSHGEQAATTVYTKIEEMMNEVVEQKDKITNLQTATRRFDGTGPLQIVLFKTERSLIHFFANGSQASYRLIIDDWNIYLDADITRQEESLRVALFRLGDIPHSSGKKQGYIEHTQVPDTSTLAQDIANAALAIPLQGFIEEGTRAEKTVG